MRRLFWLVGGLLVVAAAVFAVANRAPLALDLWPVPYEIMAPTWLAVLGALLLGWLFGALMGWLQGGPARRAARDGRSRVAALEAQVTAMKGALAEATAQAAGKGAAPPPRQSFTQRMLAPVLRDVSRTALPTATLPSASMPPAPTRAPAPLPAPSASSPPTETGLGATSGTVS